ncbi:MAG: acyl carrier protein [Lachnospiraceae bacterium]|nr:acyl carrier protein [Lachnospiraceae bacterium]
MNTKKEWLLKWFEENGTVDRNTLENNLDVNYLDAGYIDSFVFISLIGDIEEEFGISFENEQFMDRSFATINGLDEILNKMVK